MKDKINFAMLRFHSRSNKIVMNTNTAGYFCILFFCGILCFHSCTEKTEAGDLNAFGYSFYPVAKGKSWVYTSDSIIYSSGGTRIDTVRSFIKEEIVDTFVNEERNTVFKIDRFFRRQVSDPWLRINSWTTFKDQTRAIRTEENLKFVKLVFPVKTGLRWDGNVFVDKNIKISVAGESLEAYKNWKYRMEDIAFKYNFAGQTINAIKVNLVDDSSIIDRRKVTEYYGNNIGLLKKEMTILDGDGSKPNEDWTRKAQKGFIHTLTLIEVK